jgi:hypothetical protein
MFNTTKYHDRMKIIEKKYTSTKNKKKANRTFIKSMCDLHEEIVKDFPLSPSVKKGLKSMGDKHYTDSFEFGINTINFGGEMNGKYDYLRLQWDKPIHVEKKSGKWSINTASNEYCQTRGYPYLYELNDHPPIGYYQTLYTLQVLDQLQKDPQNKERKFVFGKN